MDIDDLLEAFERCASSRAELKQCKESCDYDAGYYCQDQQREFSEAKFALKQALDSYIAEQVSLAMNMRLGSAST